MSHPSLIIEFEKLPERLQHATLGDFLDDEQCVVVYRIIKKHQKGETGEIEFCEELRHYLETTECERKGARPDLLSSMIYAETQIFA
jgi:hypothetical protein